jgi:nucleotide-binding universal stress UspA family protein
MLTTTRPITTTPTTVFARVVCGVDRSNAGVLAARAAGLLTAPAGSLALIAVDDPSIAVHAGWSAPQMLAELTEEAQAALERGIAEAEPLHNLDAKLAVGNPLHRLLAEIARRDATLVAVGSHGFSRAMGIALGAVSTHLLHAAPCAVLIARGPIEVGRWPRTIVVGLDGSPDSERALAVAHELAGRFDLDVRVVTGTQDAHVDLDAARRLAPDLEEHDARPMDALKVAAETTDLVIVGSRGMCGLRALGSLSERLAHEGRHSVLVVRPQGRPLGVR